MGQSGSGKEVHMLGVEGARVHYGRIIEMWGVADTYRAMTEVGISLPT
jgi:hypothetical protein